MAKVLRESTTEATKQYFARQIREGGVEEARGAILELLREMDQHRRMGRFSTTSIKMADQFKQACQQFLMGKAKLEKLEKVIERQQDQWDDANPAAITSTNTEKDLLAAAPVWREQCVQLGEVVLKYRESLNHQVQRDRKIEQEVVEVFESCLQRLPRNERGRLRLVTQEKTKGLNIDKRVETLLAIIRKLASAVPAIRHDEINRLMDKARKAAAEERYQDALESLDQLFRYDKQHLEGHRLRAEVHRLGGDRSAWLSELRLITGFDGTEGCDFFALAEVQRKDGQDDEALENYHKAAERAPTPEYLEAWGDSAMRMGRWALAATAFQKVLVLRPERNHARHKLGAALFEENRRDGALQVLCEAVEACDDRAATRVFLGRIYRDGGMLEEAEHSLRRAVALDFEDAEARYWLGVVLLERGEINQALYEADLANRLEEDRPRNRLLLARCLDAIGQTAKASEVLEESIQQLYLPPFDLLMAYCQFRRQSRRSEAALEVLSPVLKRYPHQLQLRTQYGLLLLDAGDLRQAAAYLDPAAVMKQ